MNVIDMMKALKSGKKIRHKNWGDKEYITFEAGKIKKHGFSDPMAGLEHFIDILEEDNWQEYNNLVPFKDVPNGEMFKFKDSPRISFSVKVNCSDKNFDMIHVDNGCHMTFGLSFPGLKVIYPIE